MIIKGKHKVVSSIIAIIIVIISAYCFYLIYNVEQNIRTTDTTPEQLKNLIIGIFLIAMLSIVSALITLKIKTQIISKEDESLVKIEVESETSDNPDDKEEIILDTKTNQLFEALKDVKSAKSVIEYGDMLFVSISEKIELTQGLLFIKDSEQELFSIKSKYAWYSDDKITDILIGDGLSGQVAKDQKALNIVNLPENYINVISGLGDARPKSLMIIPIISNKITIGILELTTFKKINSELERQLNELADIVGKDIKKWIK